MPRTSPSSVSSEQSPSSATETPDQSTGCPLAALETFISAIKTPRNAAVHRKGAKTAVHKSAQNQDLGMGFEMNRGFDTVIDKYSDPLTVSLFRAAEGGLSRISSDQSAAISSRCGPWCTARYTLSRRRLASRSVKVWWRGRRTIRTSAFT